MYLNTEKLFGYILSVFLDICGIRASTMLPEQKSLSKYYAFKTTFLNLAIDEL